MAEQTLEQMQTRLDELRLKQLKRKQIQRQSAKPATVEPGAISSTSPFSGLVKSQLEGKTPLKPLADFLKQEGLPLAGATGGSLVGFAAGGPFGAIPGAAVGGGIGEAMNQELRRFGQLEGQAPEGIPESLKAIGKTGATMGISEAAGQGIFGLLSKLAKPFSRSLLPGAKETQELIGPKGGLVTPAKATENRALDILDNFTENAILGGGPLRKQNLKNVEIFDDLIDDFASRFRTGATPEETGALVQGGLEQKRELFNTVSRKLFAKLDEVAGGSLVNIAPVKKSALDLLQKAELGISSPGTRKILNAILKKGDQISFEEAQILRSDLLGVSRGTTDLLPDKPIGVAKKISGELDVAMEAGISPEANEAFRTANAFFKQGKQTFNNALIKSIAKNDADVLLDKVLRAKKPGGIRRVRQIVDNPEIWKNVQGEFIERVLTKGSKTGELVGKTLENELNRFGSQAVKEILPKGESKIFENFIRGLKIIQRKNPESTGRIFIQLQQAGAAGAALAFDFDKTAAVILLGPLAVGRAFTSPGIVKFLTEGIQLGSKARNSATFLTRLSALLTKEGIDNQIQQNAEQRPNFIQRLAAQAEKQQPDQSARSPFANIVQQNEGRLRNRLLR